MGYTKYWVVLYLNNASMKKSVSCARKRGWRGWRNDASQSNSIITLSCRSELGEASFLDLCLYIRGPTAPVLLILYWFALVLMMDALSDKTLPARVGMTFNMPRTKHLLYHSDCRTTCYYQLFSLATCSSAAPWVLFLHCHNHNWACVCPDRWELPAESVLCVSFPARRNWLTDKIRHS